MELSPAIPTIALITLMVTSTWLGLSDWRNRTINMKAVLTCYAAAITVNVVVIIIMMAAMADPDTTVSKLIETAGPTIIVIALLSGAIIVFWRLGLLASGDAYAIPALLSVLLFVATPAVVVAYFIAAMAFVLTISVVENVRNNMRYIDRLYGPLWHRLYLLLFFYYGDGSQARYAFAYGGPGNTVKANGIIRRDYDAEPFYEGKERTWLVPGLPLLPGFAPATAVIAVAMVAFPHPPAVPA